MLVDYLLPLYSASSYSLATSHPALHSEFSWYVEKLSSHCIITPSFNPFQVLVPLLTNEKNHEQWPAVVSQDVKRHVHTLKSNVYVVSGQVKGKTLLPLPVGTEKVGELGNLDDLKR